MKVNNVTLHVMLLTTTFCTIAWTETGGGHHAQLTETPVARHITENRINILLGFASRPGMGVYLYAHGGLEGGGSLADYVSG